MLRVDDGWVQVVTPIRWEVVRYFSNNFSIEEWEHPNLNGVYFLCPPNVDNDSLISPFSTLKKDQVT